MLMMFSMSKTMIAKISIYLQREKQKLKKRIEYL